MAHFRLAEYRNQKNNELVTQLFRDEELIAVGTYSTCMDVLNKQMAPGDTFQEVSASGLKLNVLNYDNIVAERVADQDFRQGLPNEQDLNNFDSLTQMIPMEFKDLKIGQKFYRNPAASAYIIKIEPKPGPSRYERCYRCGIPIEVWNNGRTDDGMDCHICANEIVFIKGE